MYVMPHSTASDPTPETAQSDFSHRLSYLSLGRNPAAGDRLRVEGDSIWIHERALSATAAGSAGLRRRISRKWAAALYRCAKLFLIIL